MAVTPPLTPTLALILTPTSDLTPILLTLALTGKFNKLY